MQNLSLQRIDGHTGLPATVRTSYRAKTALSRVSGSLLKTTGNIITNLVSIPFPETALRMAQSRRNYLSLRGYEAGEINRLNLDRFNSLTNRAPDAEINGKMSRLRALSRDQVRNNPLACNLKRVHKNNVVGDSDVGQGVMIKPQVLKPNGDKDQRINDILEEAWENFRDHLEFTGRWGFNDIASMADHELFEVGEVLAIFRDVPTPGSQLPFSVEMIEADRLPMDTDMWTTAGATNSTFFVDDGNGMPSLSPLTGKPDQRFVKHGIEYNDLGQVEAYHILRDHPGETFLFRNPTFETVRWSREDVIHYFEPLRAEQTRGVSPFVSVLTRMADLDDLIEYELQAAKAQSAFGIHFDAGIDNVDPLSGSAANPIKDAAGNAVTTFQPGMFTQGPSKAEFYQGMRPGNSFKPFSEMLMRGISSGVGMSFSSATRDYSQGSYSSLRQEDNEDARTYRSAQGLHKRHLCLRVWRRFVRALFLMGYPGLPSLNEYRKNKHRYERAHASFPGRDHINPLQEISAEAVALANGIKDLSEVTKYSAKTPEDRIKATAALKNVADNLGVKIAFLHGTDKLSGSAQENTDKLNEEALTDKDNREIVDNIKQIRDAAGSIG